MSKLYIKLELKRAQLLVAAPDVNGKVEVTASYRMVEPSLDGDNDPAMNYGQTKSFKYEMQETDVSWDAIDLLVGAEEGISSTYP